MARRVARAIGFALLFGLIFGIIGAALGFTVGLGFSAFDEIVLHRGNPQGPLLFLLTGPLGVLIGLPYGWIKGVRPHVNASTTGSSALDGQTKRAH